MAGQAKPDIYFPEFANWIVPNATYPIYYTERPSIAAGIPDKMLSLIAPLVSYWALSLLFHVFDTYGENWKWLERYRIHESDEVRSKNLVSKWQVVKTVLAQQTVQTILGVLLLEDGDPAATDHIAKMRWMSPLIVQSTLLWVGNPNIAQSRLESWGPTTIYFIYWWAIPTLQMLFAFFIVDTWQYFWHRFFHTNKFLYRHIHSWHHRLYVPYSFGALYNHPIEGLVLDSIGTVMAQLLSGLTIRQAILLFSFSSLKTVDDHCGYSLPFDPLQFFFSNNADYHDIHHQAIGIKKNFAQPFFIHWDVIMGTRMTRQEAQNKLKKAKAKGIKHENGNSRVNGNGVTDSDKEKVE